MAELSKIRKNGVDYDIKDAVAREAIEQLEQNGVTDEQIASAVEEYMAEHPNSSQNPTGTKVYVTLADDGTIVIAPDVGDGLSNDVTITVSLSDDGTIVIGGE